jgi:DNA-binding response OmpR family regulator
LLAAGSPSNTDRPAPADYDVLVVEDDQDCRELLCSLLSLEGYRVRAAGSGAEALVALAKMNEPPRLVFLDLVMPGMNGLELLGEMRRAPTLAAIPVVMHSGLSEQPYLGTRPGVDHWLMKPARLDELLAIARRLTT